MKMIIFQNFAIFRKNLGGMESSGAETLGLGWGLDGKSNAHI